MTRRLLPLLSLGLACGCGLMGGPKAALERFLKAEQAGKYPEAYALVCSEDEAAKPLADYLQEKKEDHQAQARLGLSYAAERYQDKTTFEVTELSEAGESAAAKARFRMADTEALMKSVLGEDFKANIAAGQLDASAVLGMIEAKYKDHAIPMRSEQRSFKLRKEKGGWRVCLDWALQKRLGEQTAAAESLAAKGDFKAAEAAYEGILKLQFEPARAAAARKRLEELEAQAYLPLVVLKDLQAKRSDHAGAAADYQHVAEVGAVLKNTGPRTVIAADIVVDLLDRLDLSIRRDRFSPILPGSESSGQPLPPGESRYFHYVLLKVPADWRPRARVAVSGIKLLPGEAAAAPPAAAPAPEAAQAQVPPEEIPLPKP